jgi:hypothetical protein
LAELVFSWQVPAAKRTADDMLSEAVADVPVPVPVPVPSSVQASVDHAFALALLTLYVLVSAVEAIVTQEKW